MSSRLFPRVPPALLVFIAIATATLLCIAGVQSIGPSRPGYTAAGGSVAWPMYKYDAGRTGFWPFHNSVLYRGYSVSWRFEAELCIATAPALADVDGDGALEIVFGSCDGYAYCVDGRGELEWRYGAGGLSSPAIGDFDGDGLLEVGIGSSGGTLWILDAATGEPEYSLKGSFSASAPAAYDIDGDGADELIAGDLNGLLHIIDYDKGGYSDRSIAIGDSMLFAPSIGDVDGDRGPDIVVGTTVSTGEFGAVKGLLAVVSPSTLSIMKRLVLDEEVNGAAALHDVDGDGAAEIIFTTKHSLYVYDIGSDSILLHISFGDTVVDAAPSIGDFDGDGGPDIAVATAQGLYVYSLDGREIFSFPFIRAVAPPIIGDIDGDGFNEAIVSDHSGKLLIIDYRNGVEYILQTHGPLMAPAAIGDVDGDGLYEVVVGSRDFNLYCIKGVPAATQGTTAPASSTTSSTPPSVQESSTTPSIPSPPPSTTGASQYTAENTGRWLISQPLVVLVIALAIITTTAYILTHRR